MLHENTYSNAEIKNFIWFNKISEFLTNKKVIKAENLEYKNDSKIDKKYFFPTETITHEVTNTVTWEHNWKINIDVEANLPFKIDPKATIKTEYSGKKENVSTVKETKERVIKGEEFDVRAEHVMKVNLKVTELTKTEFGYLDAWINSQSSVNYEIINKENEAQNQTISFGKLLENVQYHDGNTW